MTGSPRRVVGVDTVGHGARGIYPEQAGKGLVHVRRMLEREDCDTGALKYQYPIQWQG